MGCSSVVRVGGYLLQFLVLPMLTSAHLSCRTFHCVQCNSSKHPSQRALLGGGRGSFARVKQHLRMQARCMWRGPTACQEDQDQQSTHIKAFTGIGVAKTQCGIGYRKYSIAGRCLSCV